MIKSHKYSYESHNLRKEGRKNTELLFQATGEDIHNYLDVQLSQ